MRIWKFAITAGVVMVAVIALNANPVVAYNFGVALILSGSNAKSAQYRHIREGFKLASAERDYHPVLESDGHLVDLDVYITIIDGRGDIGVKLQRLVTQDAINVVVTFDPSLRSSIVKNKTERNKKSLCYCPTSRRLTRMKN